MKLKKMFFVLAISLLVHFSSFALAQGNPKDVLPANPLWPQGVPANGLYTPPYMTEHRIAEITTGQCNGNVIFPTEKDKKGKGNAWFEGFTAYVQFLYVESESAITWELNPKVTMTPTFGGNISPKKLSISVFDTPIKLPAGPQAMLVTKEFGSEIKQRLSDGLFRLFPGESIEITDCVPGANNGTKLRIHFAIVRRDVGQFGRAQ